MGVHFRLLCSWREKDGNRTNSMFWPRFDHSFFNWTKPLQNDALVNCQCSKKKKSSFWQSFAIFFSVAVIKENIFRGFSLQSCWLYIVFSKNRYFHNPGKITECYLVPTFLTCDVFCIQFDNLLVKNGKKIPEGQPGNNSIPGHHKTYLSLGISLPHPTWQNCHQ